MNVSIGDQAIVTYIYSIILILYELVILLIRSYYNRQYKRYYDRPTQGTSPKRSYTQLSSHPHTGYYPHTLIDYINVTTTGIEQ